MHLTPPPSDARQTGKAIQTCRVSVVRAQQCSNVTTNEVKKIPEIRQPVPPPKKETGERHKGEYYLLTLKKSRHKKVL